MAKETRVLKFELTPEMVAVIGNALGMMPYNQAAPVVAELQKQINAQQEPLRQDE